MRIAIFAVLIFSCAPVFAGQKPKPKADAGLVGAWGQSGETLFIFKADGTGKMENNDIRWSLEGKELVVKERWGTQRMVYRLKGDALSLVMGGEEQSFTRMGGKASAPAAKAKVQAEPARETAAAPAAQADRLSALLVSSPWCSFSYNKVSGSSSSKRVTFSPDGSWSQGAQSEGYSSGYGGTMASQHNSEGGGRWAVQGGQLLMSNPGEGAYELAPLDLAVKQNSNGYPILVADGVEYSQCR